MKVCQEEEEEEMTFFTCLGLKCFLHSFKKNKHNSTKFSISIWHVILLCSLFFKQHGTFQY